MLTYTRHVSSKLRTVWVNRMKPFISLTANFINNYVHYCCDNTGRLLRSNRIRFCSALDLIFSIGLTSTVWVSCVCRICPNLSSATEPSSATVLIFKASSKIGNSQYFNLQSLCRYVNKSEILHTKNNRVNIINLIPTLSMYIT